MSDYLTVYTVAIDGGWLDKYKPKLMIGQFEQKGNLKMLQEHIAINVKDPAAMADWYGKHLGLKVVRDTGQAYFIADDSGHGIIEIYNNPADEVPDYANMNPLLLHIAFVSEDVDADEARLIAAGATKHGETIREAGDTIAMLRDPWGLAIQLAKRKNPML